VAAGFCKQTEDVVFDKCLYFMDDELVGSATNPVSISVPKPHISLVCWLYKLNGHHADITYALPRHKADIVLQRIPHARPCWKV